MAEQEERKMEIDDDNTEIGYDIDIFMPYYKQSAQSHICPICQMVLNKPTNIMCKAEHMFCNYCLTQYFEHSNNASLRCPACREEGLKKSNIRISRYNTRIIESFIVKCKLQLYEEGKEEKNNEDVCCNWTGEVRNLRNHLKDNCILALVECEDCKRKMKRFELKEHSQVCIEKHMLCDLNCGVAIRRKNLLKHKCDECAFTKMACSECEKDCLRKDMKSHTESCPEYPVDCPYIDYGCNETKLKRCELPNHLESNEVKHLKLKVQSLENQINYQERRTSNDHFFAILSGGTVIQCSLEHKHKSTTSICSQNRIASPTSRSHYCFANIGYATAKEIGFESPQLVNNSVIFRRDNNQNICAYDTNQKQLLEFPAYTANTAIQYRSCGFIWTNSYHLITAGDYLSEVVSHKMHSENNVLSITKNTIATLPHRMSCPSIQTLNDERLFVAGGWWGGRFLSNCCIYNFELKQWLSISSMNKGHQCAGIFWNKNNNKMIVAGGFGKIRNVEQYDFEKDIWTNMATLNKEHNRYPHLTMLSNGLLAIIGCNDIGLGNIELLDPRDSRNKWTYVDTVANYFGIPNHNSDAFGCFC